MGCSVSCLTAYRSQVTVRAAANRPIRQLREVFRRVTPRRLLWLLTQSGCSHKADIEIHDAERHEEYRQIAARSVAAYGGRYIVRDGIARRLEGTWAPTRMVVLQFPSVDRATQWWDSADYAPAKLMRQMSASTEMILVPGV